MSIMNSGPTPRRRRERPKVLRLTDAAAARIHEILDKSAGRYIGVRVGGEAVLAGEGTLYI